jgi:hypothetical protein
MDINLSLLAMDESHHAFHSAPLTPPATHAHQRQAGAMPAQSLSAENPISECPGEETNRAGLSPQEDRARQAR